jgi:hypothetical protein
MEAEVGRPNAKTSLPPQPKRFEIPTQKTVEKQRELLKLVTALNLQIDDDGLKTELF